MCEAVFELLEIIAEQLVSSSPSVITANSLSNAGQSSILQTLQTELQRNTASDAIVAAVAELETHFAGKGASLPFVFVQSTFQFTASDLDFLQFICQMKAIRSLGKHSKAFECSVSERLRLRATGSIHRVGHPRDTKKKQADFNSHLKTLGFEQSVLLGAEKDGGLDILWQLPLGTNPHRPFVSVQCKNGWFNLKVADESLGSSGRSLAQHGRLQPSVHIPCVFFNDYVWPERLTTKPLQFVPLGLTDLAKPLSLIDVVLI
jgi:hypothetical protein